jgi:beta-barrel assembly-enhancing protease
LKNKLDSLREMFTSVASASVDLFAPHAVNPVTGEKQLMLLNEEWEIQADKEFARHQFASDYGKVQDYGLNNYLQQVGADIARHTHRPEMPYSFQVVNASTINAYAFPAGSVGVTRGILLLCENEAELAALIGHELGHINSRHTALEMSKEKLAQTLLDKIATYAAIKKATYGNVVSQIGSLGAGAVLASYSRDNEREADRLGMEYMTRAGYNIEGYVTFMETLNRLYNQDVSAAAVLFASHPMNQERYETAVNLKNTEFSRFITQPIYRERYMDHTAGIRELKPAIELFQQSEESIAQNDFDSAETFVEQGLKLAPNDYAGLMMMAICKLAKPEYEQALYFSEQARCAYPEEPRSNYLNGLVKIGLERFDEAVADLTVFESELPGIPQNIFYRGYAYECLGKKQESIEDYCFYLQQRSEGDDAQYAYQRLVEWGVIKSQN